jgi:hypothetical protein
MTNAMTTLPEIRLDQQGVATEFPGSVRQTWYGWIWPIPGYYHFEPHKNSVRLGPATIQCDVILPTILLGDPADIGGDISEALGLHAQKHLGRPD